MSENVKKPTYSSITFFSFFLWLQYERVHALSR